MTVTKRTRDKSNGNQDNTTSSDGGDSLTASTSSSASTYTSGISTIPIVSPRKGIRDYSDKSKNTRLYEDSYLLYRGRKSYLMVPIAKALTWFTKISLYYHLESLGKYHLRRIIAYFFVVLIAGLVKDFLLTPPSILPNYIIDFIDTNIRTAKQNFLNVYFVKWGWLWTYIALVPFFLFTRFYFVKRNFEKDQKLFQYSKQTKRKKSVHFREPLEEIAGDEADQTQTDHVDKEKKTETACRNVDNQQLPQKNSTKQYLVQLAWQIIPTLVRLTISTVIWSVSVNFFVNLHHSKAACHFSNSTIVDSVTDKAECTKHGYHWRPIGFDISGHIFLMIFSNLIRIEELTFLIKKFDEFSGFRYLGLPPSRSLNFATPYRFKFSLFHLLTTLLIAINLMITLIWDFMIIQTALFYHTWDQKIAGFAWAVIAWAMTYQAMYQQLYLHLQVAP